jgi:hypothetical protein
MSINLNLKQIRNIIAPYPNIKLQISTLSNCRYRIYIEDDEGNDNTLIKYAEFKNNNEEDILSFGYLAIQTWWTKKVSEIRQEHFMSMSTLKKKDGLGLGQFDQYDIKEIIEAVYGMQSKTIDSSKSKIQNTNTNSKSKGLTSQQAKSYKELCDYECDSCGVNINKAIEEMLGLRNEIIKEKNRLIHVHHVLASDHTNRNHPRYLLPLCCICHGEQNGHGHKMQAGDSRGHFIIKTIKANQGI